MRRALAVASALALAGCATTVPLQTASVVPEGTWRVGGEVSTALGCGNPFTGLDGLLTCGEYPDGIPTPQLRALARRGLGGGFDLGLQLAGQGEVLAVTRPFHLTLGVDAKKELWSAPSPFAGRQLLALGLGAEGALAGRLGLHPTVRVGGALPVFYGLQTAHLEWVFKAQVAVHGDFQEVGGTAGLPPVAGAEVGVAVGLFHREPVSWGVQLGYDAPTRDPGHGALQASFGWLWDLPGAP